MVDQIRSAIGISCLTAVSLLKHASAWMADYNAIIISREAANASGQANARTRLLLSKHTHARSASLSHDHIPLAIDTHPCWSPNQSFHIERDAIHQAPKDCFTFAQDLTDRWLCPVSSTIPSPCLCSRTEAPCPGVAEALMHVVSRGVRNKRSYCRTSSGVLVYTSFFFVARLRTVQSCVCRMLRIDVV